MGRVFGMMPRLKAFLFPREHPPWNLEKEAGRELPDTGYGLTVFGNAVAHLGR